MEQPRFCDQCGKSLVPLAGPHVERACAECGRTIHAAEPGEGGKGIRVEKGDTFILPPGSISISLDLKKTTSRFTRPELTWFVQHLIMQPLDRSADEITGLFEYWDRKAEATLKASDKLSHLNLENESGQLKAIDIAMRHKGSLESWAFTSMAHVAQGKRFLNDGELAEAILSACRAQAAHSMIVFTKELEDYVWTGYQHSQLIYGIAKASAQTPAEAEAIEALRPIFERLSEDVLHAWVEAGADIGPRIGVTDVDEKLLKALARFHLNEYEQHRKQKQLDREQGSRMWANLIAAAAAGATVATVVLAVLRALGVL